MRVRSVANGNIIDLPEDHGLIAAGIYEPVEEETAEAVEPPVREAVLLTPEAPVDTTALQTPPPAKRSRRRR